MFLIEQPSPRLPFLSHFIETQMFTRFIDLKIISLIDMQRYNSRHHHNHRNRASYSSSTSCASRFMTSPRAVNSPASTGNTPPSNEQQEQTTNGANSQTAVDLERLIEPNVRIFDAKIRKYKEIENELSASSIHRSSQHQRTVDQNLCTNDAAAMLKKGQNDEAAAASSENASASRLAHLTRRLHSIDVQKIGKHESSYEIQNKK